MWVEKEMGKSVLLRKMVPLFVAVSAILALDTIPARSEQPSTTQPLSRRHVIVAFDISTSMKGRRINKQRMDDLKGFLEKILYKSFPTSVGRPHSLDSKLFDAKEIDFSRPLYARGDILTYYTFAERVEYELQRKKEFVARSELSTKLPAFPKGFSGGSTFLEVAYVAAYDNFDSPSDGETFLVLVSDMERDRRRDDETSEYIFQRMHMYERQFHKLPCYSLRIHGHIWINVYKLVPLGGPSGQPFQLVEESNRAQPLAELRFKRQGSSDKASLTGSYLLMANPKLRVPLEVQQVVCAVRHVSADNPVTAPRTICSGATCREPVRLESLDVERRYISPDYRVTLEIKYQPRSGAPDVFRLQEVSLVPDSDCELCLSDQSGVCLRQVAVPLTQEEDLFKSTELGLAEKTSAASDCRVKDVRLLVRERKCNACVSLIRPSAVGEQLLSKLRIALSQDFSRSLPVCTAVDSVLQVFYEQPGSDKTRIQEIPFALKLMAGEPTTNEVHVMTPETPSFNGLSLGWSDGMLEFKDHMLGVTEDSPLKHARIEKLVVKLGSLAQWSFGPIWGRDLPCPIAAQLTSGQSQQLLEQKPEQARVELTYRSRCLNETRHLALNLPVRMPAVDCPEGALFVGHTTSPSSPTREIHLDRDASNNLKLRGLTLAINPKGPGGMLVDRIDGVELRMKGMSKTWGAVNRQSLPATLSEKVLSAAETQGLAQGEHEGEVIVTYRCPASVGKPMKTTQRILVTVPPPVLPQFLLTHKNGSPAKIVGALAFGDKCSITDLCLTEKKNTSPQALGVTIKQIEVGPKSGGTSWHKWTSASALPFPLDFKMTDVGTLPRDPSGNVEGKIRVSYDLRGSVPQPFEQTFAVKVTSIPIWPILILLAGVVGGVCYLVLKLVGGGKTSEFTILMFRGRDTLRTDTFTLKKGQKLFLSDEGQPRCTALNCRGFWLENRKGILYLVRPDSEEPEQIFADSRYRLTGDDGREVVIRIDLATHEEPSGEPVGPNDDPPPPSPKKRRSF